MANELIDFASGIGILEPETFCTRVLQIWSNLKADTERLRDALTASPDDELVAKDAVEAAERFLAFGDLMRCGNMLVNHRIADMRREALENPNDPASAEIIGLTNVLEGVNSEAGDGSN